MKSRPGSDASFASSWNSLCGELQRDPADRRYAGDHVDRELARPPGALLLQRGPDPLDQVVVESLLAQLLLDRRHLPTVPRVFGRG